MVRMSSRSHTSRRPAWADLRFLVGVVLVLTGFLFQWPTLLTLAVYPVLIWMYVRLARTEERETRAEFGREFDTYAARVPAFVPSLNPTRDATQ